MSHESTPSLDTRQFNEASLKWMADSLTVLNHNHNVAHNALVNSFESQQAITHLDNLISRTLQSLDSAEHTTCMLGLHLRTARHYNAENGEIEELQGSIEASEEDAAKYERELKELRERRDRLADTARTKSLDVQYLPLPQPPDYSDTPLKTTRTSYRYFGLGHGTHSHGEHEGHRCSHSQDSSSNSSHSRHSHSTDRPSSHSSLHSQAHVISASEKLLAVLMAENNR